VFDKVSDSSPKYAIRLCFLNAVGNEKTVSLETTLGEVEYVIMFDDAKKAHAFKKAVVSQASKGAREQLRKVRTASFHWVKDWYHFIFLWRYFVCSSVLVSSFNSAPWSRKSL
jgi:hypothetical protein